eukprot:CAMPEP_0182443552 /NCGR_PEP_ID=MMETSP1172-20130603/2259_1 /TAXON_ID=708627 /ORGANISM="Timspurckia oligopyrenoides, Strain CCMP3278" /LENGTH=557 /DNA_ID=CAMNT_0024638869 /DNA_START=161 /DNA_END=1834 /DNA_ORIENTATION=+
MRFNTSLTCRVSVDKRSLLPCSGAARYTVSFSAKNHISKRLLYPLHMVADSKNEINISEKKVVLRNENPQDDGTDENEDENIETGTRTRARKATWLGKTHSEESKKKISEANRGRVPWNKGRKHSEETKRKIAERTRLAMSSGKIRSRLAEYATGRRHSKETRSKIKANTKRGLERKRRQEPETSRSNAPVRPTFDPPSPLISSELLDQRNVFSSRRALERRADQLPLNITEFETIEIREEIGLKFKQEAQKDKSNSEQGKNGRRSTSGARMSPEAREKLSKRIKSLWEDQNYRNRVMTGIREKIRKDQEREITDPDFKKTKSLSKEHREKIRRTLKSRYDRLAREGKRKPSSSAAAKRAKKAAKRTTKRSSSSLNAKEDPEQSPEVVGIAEVDDNFVAQLQASGLLPPLQDLPDSERDSLKFGENLKLALEVDELSNLEASLESDLSFDRVDGERGESLGASSGFGVEQADELSEVVMKDGLSEPKSEPSSDVTFSSDEEDEDDEDEWEDFEDDDSDWDSSEYDDTEDEANDVIADLKRAKLRREAAEIAVKRVFE